MNINLKHQWISNPALAPAEYQEAARAFLNVRRAIGRAATGRRQGSDTTKADLLNSARLAQLIAAKGKLVQELV